MRNILAYLIVVIIVGSCINPINQNDSDVIARVNNKYLYITDIGNIVPANASPRDSIAIVRSFVNDWVKTNVMISQAEQNLPPEQLDFSKQLEEYRNSLIIYSYETSLIDQNLDTVVSDQEIEEYYNSHLSDFELKENITKAAYIIIDNNGTMEDQFDHIFSLADSVLFDSLEYMVPAYSLSANLDTSNWISFFEIQKIIPVETYNREHFLKNNRLVKIVSEDYIYYVKFFDFKIKDDISPLDFKRNDIYNIIISKRKVMLAKEVRNDIYDRALLNSEFEVYYHE